MRLLALALALASAAMGADRTADLPDDRLTPGAIDKTVTRAEVCTAGFSHTRRHTSDALKAAVYAEYGIREHRPGDYEIDHRVPLELGGADVKANLWPESYRSEWSAHLKDQLENAMRRDVCAGRVPLAAAQLVFLGDWIAVYRERHPQ